MCSLRSLDRDNLTGFLHQPASESRGGIALTHSAGGNCNGGLLIAVAEAFCATGWTVLRYNLPFRRNRPFGPPFPASAAADQAGIREAVDYVRTLAAGPIIAGGHSYGGRQTSMIAAKQRELCDAVIALSYPLHPPKKPDQPRTAHFDALQIPILFVHGSNDPFGTADEMQEAIRVIPAATKLVIVEGAGHDLKSGKANLQTLVVAPLEALLRNKATAAISVANS